MDESCSESTYVSQLAWVSPAKLAQVHKNKKYTHRKTKKMFVISQYITLPTKVRLVKAMFVPVAVDRHETWTKES